MPYPNVVDMIFGRIDRNNDTSFRDRSLNQNNEQFLTQAELDRLKMDEAQRQFNASIGLETNKFTTAQEQQAFSNDMAVQEGVARGMFKPRAAGPAAPADGAGPGNMFMQGGAFSQPSSTPVGVSGVRAVTPAEKFEEMFSQNKRIDAEKLRAGNQEKSNRINALIKLKIPPALAYIQANDPDTFRTIVSQPQNMMAALTMIANGEQGAGEIAKVMMEQMAGYSQAVNRPQETDSTTAYHNANATNAMSSANLHNAQATNIGNMNAGEGVYNQAFAQVAATGIDSSDPRFPGAIRQAIQNMNVPDGIKQAASAVATRDIQPRTLGVNPFAALLNNQRPAVPPTVTAPPQITGPVGASTSQLVYDPRTGKLITRPNGATNDPALRFTQPNNGQLIPNSLLDLLNKQRQRQSPFPNQ